MQTMCRGLHNRAMHADANYPNENRFAEIVAPQHVVVEHLGSPHHFPLTITLAVQGTRTQVGWRQVFDMADEKQRIAEFVAPANEQNLDRLAAEVLRAPPTA